MCCAGFGEGDLFAGIRSKSQELGPALRLSKAIVRTEEQRAIYFGDVGKSDISSELPTIRKVNGDKPVSQDLFGVTTPNVRNRTLAIRESPHAG